MSFWPFWMRILVNLLCTHNNSISISAIITKFGPNTHPRILSPVIENGGPWTSPPRSFWQRHSTALSYTDLSRPKGATHPKVALVCVSWHTPQWVRGGWRCIFFCGGHHIQRGKTTTGSAVDGAVIDVTQILAYVVHNKSPYQLYLRILPFYVTPFFWQSVTFWHVYGEIVFNNLNCVSSGWHMIGA